MTRRRRSPAKEIRGCRSPPDRPMSSDLLDRFDLVEENRQAMTRGRMPGLEDLTTVPIPDRQRKNHALRPAVSRHRDPCPARYGPLERVVLFVRQLPHASPDGRPVAVHQPLARHVSTAVARSISSTDTHSSAAFASPMSPGPKQIAAIPAALSNAASVHAVIPAT